MPRTCSRLAFTPGGEDEPETSCNPIADPKAPRLWFPILNDAVWTDWATKNTNGSLVGPIFTPFPVTALMGREQAGYGLINLCIGFLYPDGSEGWTAWVTNNFEGNQVGPVRCPSGMSATGISVFEQAGFGLVDSRLDYPGGSTGWLTGNNQQWLEELNVPPGKLVAPSWLHSGLAGRHLAPIDSRGPNAHVFQQLSVARFGRIDRSHVGRINWLRCVGPKRARSCLVAIRGSLRQAFVPRPYLLVVTTANTDHDSATVCGLEWDALGMPRSRPRGS